MSFRGYCKKGVNCNSPIRTVWGQQPVLIRLFDVPANGSEKSDGGHGFCFLGTYGMASVENMRSWWRFTLPAQEGI
ncbi:hypothetical protein NC652_036392 [Populus alba x Populus x berolinensis]|nr:hypothetical protein NC652_036392 [Populus alba x Populus x berolinensis]